MNRERARKHALNQEMLGGLFDCGGYLLTYSNRIQSSVGSVVVQRCDAVTDPHERRAYFNEDKLDTFFKRNALVGRSIAPKGIRGKKNSFGVIE